MNQSIESIITESNVKKRTIQRRTGFGKVEKAGELLDVELKDLQEKYQESVAAKLDGIHKLEETIADRYGMRGGIYRRLKEYDSALKMYWEGYNIWEKRSGTNSTYNLINYITWSLTLEKDYVKTDDFKELVKDAQDKLEIQIKEKEDTSRSEELRKDDWYAYADLGMCYLLNGDLISATKIYDKGIVDARDVDVDRSAGTLRSLREKDSGVIPARLLDSAIDHLEKKIKELIQKSH